MDYILVCIYETRCGYCKIFSANEEQKLLTALGDMNIEHSLITVSMKKIKNVPTLKTEHMIGNTDCHPGLLLPDLVCWYPFFMLIKKDDWINKNVDLEGWVYGHGKCNRDQKPQWNNSNIDANSIILWIKSIVKHSIPVKDDSVKFRINKIFDYINFFDE